MCCDFRDPGCGLGGRDVVMLQEQGGQDSDSDAGECAGHRTLPTGRKHGWALRPCAQLALVPVGVVELEASCGRWGSSPPPSLPGGTAGLQGVGSLAAQGHQRVRVCPK